MKRFLVGIVSGAILTVGAGVAWCVGTGLSARLAPSRAEAAVARTIRGWAIPAPARRLANPVPVNDRVLAKARAHFADHCASCHANDGSGETALGRGLFPRPPDLRAAPTQRLTDGALFFIVENGVRLTGMPAFGTPGHADDSWELVRFIRHLPSLTGREQEEMEQLNPRSPAEWRELEEERRFLEDDGGTPKPSQSSPARLH